MPEKRVTIVHPDGREYSIEPQMFTSTDVSPEGSYAIRGFQIVGYVGGEPYDGPKTLAEIEARASVNLESGQVTPGDQALPPIADSAYAPTAEPLPVDRADDTPKRSARNVQPAHMAETGEAE